MFDIQWTDEDLDPPKPWLRRGTKSVLYGPHAFWLHPWFVALAWWKLYGFPWDPRLWFAFFLHDLGYWGKAEMDNEDGERHVLVGARIMGWIFGPDWMYFTLYHSRFYARQRGHQVSQLCVADKFAFTLTPSWVYIPLARLTGELTEYRKMNADPQSKYGGEIVATSDWEWFYKLKGYMTIWVKVSAPYPFPHRASGSAGWANGWFSLAVALVMVPLVLWSLALSRPTGGATPPKVKQYCRTHPVLCRHAATATAVGTDTATPTITNTPTDEPTETPAPTETETPTDTPTVTETPAPTDTATQTETPAPTETATYVPTNTPIDTATPSETPTETATPTDTPTETPSPEPPSPPPSPVPTSTSLPTIVVSAWPTIDTRPRIPLGCGDKGGQLWPTPDPQATTTFMGACPP